MNLTYLYPAGFGVALLMSVLLIRSLHRHAEWFGLVDRPGEARRLHKQPVATVGGLGLFLAMTITGLLLVATAGLATRFPAQLAPLLPIAIGALAMHLTGLWDDRVGLSAQLKFTLQVLVAVGVFLAGVRIAVVELPFLGRIEFDYWASMALTVLWFVGVTNAFNLVDGVDGLAGGAALIATSAMFLVALTLGHYVVALFLAVIAGALLGFLHYNFPPATVFMGDAGSLLLGFLLAGLGIVSSAKTATTVAITVPVVAFGLPVLDTILAMIRRLLRGDRIWAPDRGHIHHRLLDLGFSPRKVALTLYAVCGLFALLSVVSLSNDTRMLAPGFLVLGLVVLFGIQSLRIPELLEARRLLGRRFGRRHVLGRNMEIRGYARRISGARSLRQVFAGLERAFERADFDEVEVWLSRPFLGELNGKGEAAGLQRDGDGYLWKWTGWNLGSSAPEDAWEVKLPVVSPDGSQVGRLTIRKHLVDDLPPELRVIVEDLVPAAARGLASNAEELDIAPAARIRSDEEEQAPSLRVVSG